MKCIALLPQEIARHSLTRYYYVLILCPGCSDIRAALAEIPDGRFCLCPACQRESEYVVMGEGASKRPLPFWETATFWITERCEFNRTPAAVSVHPASATQTRSDVLVVKLQ